MRIETVGNTMVISLALLSLMAVAPASAQVIRATARINGMI